MRPHAFLVFAELVGAGFLTLGVVLVALLATAAALHAGRSAAPVLASDEPIDRMEAALFARYVRGEIDAEEYHRTFDRLAAEPR